MNKQNKSSTITLENKVVAHRISDGRELIPAEIQANTSFDNNRLLNTPLSRGYSVDDERIINNYATETDMSLTDYPSPKQQKHYIFLGAGAMLLVTTTLLIAFAAS
jgi:hypothetical protein